MTVSKVNRLIPSTYFQGPPGDHVFSKSAPSAIACVAGQRNLATNSTRHATFDGIVLKLHSVGLNVGSDDLSEYGFQPLYLRCAGR